MEHDGDETALVAGLVREFRTANAGVAGDACMEIKRIGTGDMSCIRNEERAVIAEMGIAD